MRFDLKTKLLAPLLLFCVAAGADHDGKTHPPLAADAARQSPAMSVPPAAGAAGDADSASRLRALLGAEFTQPEFLPVDEAFQLGVQPVDAGRLEAAFTIADGYYLYRDKIRFTGEGDAYLAETVLPPGEQKTDEYFGEVAVFKHDFTAPITLQRAHRGAAQLLVHATYQGCAEDGICYAPVSKTFPLQLPEIVSGAFAADAGQPGQSGGASGFAPAGAGTAGPAGWAAILPGAFLAGLLLTFTPCVLPMLPILSGVIAGQSGGITRTKGGLLALAYVLGTMVTYAAMGALAGATGEQLQAYFQNIRALGIFAAVLVVMALSMFGLFPIHMPAFVQTGLQAKTRSLGGSLLPVFVLGALSAVIIGACVSPVLISFLGVAVSAGEPWLGARMMAAMALGMGMPLLALGLGAGYLLPKAGRWMETVNHIFGVLLIAVAIYLLGALPEVPVLLLWGAFLIILSVYLGATQATPPDAGGWRRFGKGVGTVMLVWGVAVLVGGFFGERDPLRPLPPGLFAGDRPGVSVSPQSETAQPAPLFIEIGTPAELEQQFARAAAGNKLVMLDYYADWCTDCVRMERTTFRDARVQETLRRDFIALKIDVTDPRNEHGKALKKRFGVFGPPAVLFFDRNGVELKNKHFYGYRDGAEFYALIAGL